MNYKSYFTAATFALVVGSQASTIFDDFENYTPGDLNGLGGWTVLNGVPSSGLDPVAIVDGGFNWLGSGFQTATVGGVESLSGGITEAYHDAAVPFVSLTSTPTSFSSEFAYTESTTGPRNSFSMRLTTNSSVSSNLLTIIFAPSVTPDEYNVSWTSGFFAAGSLSQTLSAGGATGFELNTYQDGANIGYSLTTLGNAIQSGTLAGGALATDEINRFSMMWDSASGGGPGNNSITFDNVSLVPEPSSALLGLLGASFAFLRRRRP